MEKNIKIEIKSIRENHCSILYDNLPKTKNEFKKNTETLLGLNFSVNSKEKLLVTTLWIKLKNKNVEVPYVSLNFSYITYIENIEKFITKKDEENTEIKLPNEIMSIIISDVYATGRTILSLKLLDTVLRDCYLPFNGAATLMENIKQRQR